MRHNFPGNWPAAILFDLVLFDGGLYGPLCIDYVFLHLTDCQRVCRVGMAVRKQPDHRSHLLIRGMRPVSRSGGSK
jgi:hypothetical protein